MCDIYNYPEVNLNNWTEIGKIVREAGKKIFDNVICTPVFCLSALVVAFFFSLYVNYDVKNEAITAAGPTKRLPIYCVENDKKQISISFDAAWGNEDTQQILDILKKHNVRATFFMTGGWVESYPDDVKNIASAGHDMGNHSENHKNMSQLTTQDIQLEIQKVHDKVKDLTGIEMCLFRPPYGDYDNDVITTLEEMNYYTIQWSIDSIDWKNYGRQDILDRVLNHKNLTDGAIILMHNGAKYTASALDELISELKNKGYEFVPISELIYRENYTIDHTGKQHPKKVANEEVTE